MTSNWIISAMWISGCGLILLAWADQFREFRLRRNLSAALHAKSDDKADLSHHPEHSRARARYAIASEIRKALFGLLDHPLLLKDRRRLLLAAVAFIGLGLVLACLLFLLFHAIGLAILISLGISVASFRIYLQYRYEAITDEIYLSLPQIVDGLIRCLRAGFDLNRSLSIVSTEVPDHLADEFRQLIRNRDLGQPLGEAMHQMAARLSNSDAVFLATLVATQEKSGGPLIDALASLSQILKDRERLRQKRRVASAEARMSAIILGGLPIMIASLLFSTNSAYREVLVTTQSGRLFLAFGMTLLLIGSLVMSRMIRIEAT